MIIIYGFLLLLGIGLAGAMLKGTWSVTKWVFICALGIATLPISIPYLIIKAFRDGVKDRKLLNQVPIALKRQDFLEALRLIKEHNTEDLKATVELLTNEGIDLRALKADLKVRYTQAVEADIKSRLDALKGSNFIELSSLLRPLKPIYQQYILEEGDFPTPQKMVEAKFESKELELEKPRTHDEENPMYLVRRRMRDEFAGAIEI
ncbi:hypothetical protein E0E54_20505 [Azotobacter chroococcum]|uniref:hypothetical protein n=1 Tax=Azotobacter chroococcum TaxID=353 RepID=UPI00103AC4DC|nr:hypothetical protein [Azotobacter chroococcum]TBW03320.1 hypothetical protein E0E52_15775 [Azotobacter chroococcum]TBW32074.1 hypothetical protein E0E54_20505 [Azotobacter chroococcum]